MIKTPLSTVIGGAFWTPSTTILGGTSKTFDQIIQDLFANGEQGFAYDPNDLNTMFQDAAGTVPVTGVGQPVGLILDKSKGLVFDNESVVGGNFENGLIGAVTDGSGSVSEWKLNTVNPISGTQDGKLTVSTPASLRPYLMFPSLPKRLGAIYEFSFDYKVLDGSPTISLVYNGSGTHSIGKTLNGSGRMVFKYVATGSGASDGVYFSASSPYTLQIDNVSVREVKGNHAYQTTSASRPILRQNVTTGAYYLEFDGSDDFLVTSSIDFTATDKVSLFVGVEKFSANVGILCELSENSNTNRGSFYITAPENSNGNYGFTSRGNKAAYLVMGALSSATNANDVAVISASGDISGDANKIRKNAVTNISNSDLGIGNYGNYPLYIGRRGGTAFPFNGHVYSLIGIGRLATNVETAAIEKELAKRVGVTLNV